LFLSAPDLVGGGSAARNKLEPRLPLTKEPPASVDFVTLGDSMQRAASPLPKKSEEPKFNMFGLGPNCGNAAFFGEHLWI
jgi:hypothetical protein